MAEIDPSVHEEISRLLQKGLASEADLTDSDRAFLRARSEYIKQKHKDALPSVFSPSAVKADSKAAKKTQEEKQKEEEKAAQEFQGQQDPFAADATVDPDLDDDDGEDEEPNG